MSEEERASQQKSASKPSVHFLAPEGLGNPGEEEYDTMKHAEMIVDMIFNNIIRQKKLESGEDMTEEDYNTEAHAEKIVNEVFDNIIDHQLNNLVDKGEKEEESYSTEEHAEKVVDEIFKGIKVKEGPVATKENTKGEYDTEKHAEEVVNKIFDNITEETATKGSSNQVQGEYDSMKHAEEVVNKIFDNIGYPAGSGTAGKNTDRTLNSSEIENAAPPSSKVLKPPQEGLLPKEPTEQQHTDLSRTKSVPVTENSDLQGYNEEEEIIDKEAEKRREADTDAVCALINQVFPKVENMMNSIPNCPPPDSDFAKNMKLYHETLKSHLWYEVSLNDSENLDKSIIDMKKQIVESKARIKRNHELELLPRITKEDIEKLQNQVNEIMERIETTKEENEVTASENAEYRALPELNKPVIPKSRVKEIARNDYVRDFKSKVNSFDRILGFQQQRNAYNINVIESEISSLKSKIAHLEVRIGHHDHRIHLDVYARSRYINGNCEYMCNTARLSKPAPLYSEDEVNFNNEQIASSARKPFEHFRPVQPDQQNGQDGTPHRSPRKLPRLPIGEIEEEEQIEDSNQEGTEQAQDGEETQNEQEALDENEETQEENDDNTPTTLEEAPEEGEIVASEEQENEKTEQENKDNSDNAEENPEEKEKPAIRMPDMPSDQAAPRKKEALVSDMDYYFDGFVA